MAAPRHETPASSEIAQRTAPSAATPTLPKRPFADRRASSIGLGAVRRAGTETAEAAVLAIARGCTVLDTAPQYHAGAHERALGAAIRSSVEASVCERDALIVSTKVGFIPALLENTAESLGFARLRALIQRQFIDAGLFEWNDLSMTRHSIAPAFLEHSIRGSLQRLQLEHVDCVFLDAPELQLNTCRGLEFRRRICAAFAALEELCDRGITRCYGVSTRHQFSPRFFVEIARSVAGANHRLRALQVPLSLLRPQMLIDPPKTELAPSSARVSVLAEAHQEELYVYANGCLDGGSPEYQLPERLRSAFSALDSDPCIALRWAHGAPYVGTALVGTRDRRHMDALLQTACLPPLDPEAYQLDRGN